MSFVADFSVGGGRKNITSAPIRNLYVFVLIDYRGLVM